MLSALVLAAVLGAPGEQSYLDKLPPEITVKSWLNTPGWKGLDDLLGHVYLVEFWATW